MRIGERPGGPEVPADVASLRREIERLQIAAAAERSRFERLARLTDAVNRAPNLEAVFEPALEALCQRLQVERGAILLFDADGVMRFRAWRGLAEAYRRTVEGHSPWSAEDGGAQPIAVPDVYRDAHLRPFHAAFEAEGIRALVFIPLAHGGRLLGKFMAYAAEPRTFAADDLRAARTFADQVASAVWQKRTEAERERLLEEMKETLRTNELFAAILGHDLRNPLGSILSAAELIERTAGDERAIKAATRIVSSSQRMNRMIGQLLDFARVRAGRALPVQPARLDLVPVWRDVVDELLPSARRSVDLEVVGDTQGVWDADRIGQVASNLVGNAIQHGAPDAPVRIAIDGRDAAAVVVRVHNVGQIPPALLPRVFDPFRSGRDERPHVQGLGLGLFITRQIVVAHGGVVEVTSTAEEGTTFVVRLPRGPRDGGA